MVSLIEDCTALLEYACNLEHLTKLPFLQILRGVFPPKFISFSDCLLAFRNKIKQWFCPHCRKPATLNWHGVVRGYESIKSQSIRSLRLWCSSRRKVNTGCGRSFCIYDQNRIPHHCVSSLELWQFLLKWLASHSIQQAWIDSRTSFSIESAYRWVKRLKRFQFTLRVELTKTRDPPDCKSRDELKGLLEHLITIYKDEPINCFQPHTQKGWFKEPNKSSTLQL